MAQPWEQQKGENPKRFEAFAMYRDLAPGERSQQRIAEALDKDRSLIARWSAQDGWIERVKSYDRYLDDERRRAQLLAVQQMADRHARMGQSLQGAGIADLAKLRKLQGAEGDEGRPVLQPKDMVRMVDVGARIERAARGEPTDIVAVSGSIDPLTAAIATDEDVRKSSRELVERAAAARASSAGPAADDADE